MDVSFALQALCVEALVRADRLGAGRAPGARTRSTREVARLKLAALGVAIDVLSDDPGGTTCRSTSPPRDR